MTKARIEANPSFVWDGDTGDAIPVADVTIHIGSSPYPIGPVRYEDLIIMLVANHRRERQRLRLPQWFKFGPAT